MWLSLRNSLKPLIVAAMDKAAPLPLTTNTTGTSQVQASS